jgi:hypothetical protein
MTGPLDLRFEIDAAVSPPPDSVQSGCDHGGAAASLRSGNRHRCEEKTCERRGGGREPDEYHVESKPLVEGSRMEGVGRAADAYAAA